MDDMESKLGAILSNPQMMQQIMALAQNFNQQEPAAKQEPPAPKKETPPPSRQESSPFPEMDLSMLQKLSGFARQSGIDKNQQSLLKALSPYLSRQRISKLERAMRAAKMANMATALLSHSNSGR